MCGNLNRVALAVASGMAYYLEPSGSGGNPAFEYLLAFFDGEGMRILR